MTAAEPELRQMLSAAYQLDGPARWAALDAVFRHADAAENVPFAFRARLDAIHDLHHSGEYTRALLAFSWCLSTFDRHPEATQSYDAHTLLWRYKWIVWEVTQFPGVTAERASGLIDDMQRRYLLGGHSLHAVYQHRGLVAHHMGDLAAAGHWYGEMVTARRDGLSDCAACVPSGHVAYLVADGRYEDAVAVGTPYANGGCTEQPQWMLSELLQAYLQTGRLAEAAVAHKRAYDKIRGNRHHLELIGLNVEFCGLTGNERHALAIVERHLPWLDRPASPFAAMEFASAAAFVLRRLAESGEGSLLVSRRSDDGTRQWQSSVADTHTELAALARRLAAEFDARNGNDYQGRRIESRLGATPLVPELPLTVLKGRPIANHSGRSAVEPLVRRVADLTAASDHAAAARAQLDVAYALRNAAQLADALETAEEARRSLDAAGLTADALTARYLLIELYGRTRQRTQIPVLVDELLAAPERPDTVPPLPALLEETASHLPPPRAVDQLVRASELHAASGDQAEEGRCLGLALRRVHQPEKAHLRLVARLDELISAGQVDDLAQLHEILTYIEEGAGDRAGALARAARIGPPLAGRHAQLLLRLDRAAEAEEQSRRVLETDEDNWLAMIVLSSSLRAQGRADEAHAFMEERGIEEYDLDDGEYDER